MFFRDWFRWFSFYHISINLIPHLLWILCEEWPVWSPVRILHLWHENLSWCPFFLIIITLDSRARIELFSSSGGIIERISHDASHRHSGFPCTYWTFLFFVGKHSFLLWDVYVRKAGLGMAFVVPSTSKLARLSCSIVSKFNISLHPY